MGFTMAEVQAMHASWHRFDAKEGDCSGPEICSYAWLEAEIEKLRVERDVVIEFIINMQGTATKKIKARRAEILEAARSEIKGGRWKHDHLDQSKAAREARDKEDEARAALKGGK